MVSVTFNCYEVYVVVCVSFRVVVDGVCMLRIVCDEICIIQNGYVWSGVYVVFMGLSTFKCGM